MNRIDRAIKELHGINHEARSEGWLQSFHPVIKLIVTFAFLLLVLSMDKYELDKLLLTAVYLIVSFILGKISFSIMWHRIWAMLLLVSLIGIANPLFDRQPVMTILGFTLTGGMISMISLMLKGCFAVAASYLLMVTTTMEEFCYALRKMHVPAVLVTLLLLVYRYLIVFLQEVKRMTQAYALRAPGQHGINICVWGSMVGHLFLRSIERAEVVYESMLMRGFQGEFPLEKERSCSTKDWLYGVGWIVVFVLIKWL